MDPSPSIIRRTIIESGVREKHSSERGTGGIAAFRNLAVEHESEKRELQHLNEKFSAYLNRVRLLEAKNKQLEGELDDIKKKWGFETSKIRDQFDNELNNLRLKIDEAETTKCLAQVHTKGVEYEADLLKGRIDFVYNLMNDDKQKLQFLQHQFDMFLPELSTLESRYKDMQNDIERFRGELENNIAKLNDSRNELDTHTFDRIKLQNQIQTLGDQLVFLRALHEEEIREFQSLSIPQFDVSQFYRLELTKAINDIRRDFEALNNAQQNEIESYYKVRMEEMKQQVADERRKIEEAKVSGRVEVMDVTSLKEGLKTMVNEKTELERENQSLLTLLRNLEHDAMSIRTDRERQEAQKEMDLIRINSEMMSIQEMLRNALEGNVSLRFEINTYRRLLEGEEMHLSTGVAAGGFGGSIAMASESSRYGAGGSVGGGSVVGGGGGFGSVGMGSMSSAVSSSSASYGMSSGSAMQGASHSAGGGMSGSISGLGISSGSGNASVMMGSGVGASGVIGDYGSISTGGSGGGLMAASYGSAQKQAGYVHKSSRSAIGIEDVDQNSQFILIRNNSTDDVDITGWFLLQEATSGKCQFYFPNLFLTPNMSLKIFARSSPVIGKSSENHIVADDIYKWLTEDRVETKLFKANSQLAAIFVQDFPQ